MNEHTSRITAFSLVEVTVALGVTAFCLIAIFGLLPVGLRNNQAATEQTAANGILSAVSVDLRATPLTSSTSSLYSIPLPSNPVPPVSSATILYFSSSGNFAATMQADSRYRLTVNFLPNGPNAKAATFVNLQLSWPAAVPPPQSSGCVRMFLALDRN